MYKEQTYSLRYNLDDDNARRTDRDIIVNCCGLENLARPFETIRLNGREDFYILVLMNGMLEVEIDGGLITMTPGQMITHYPHTPCAYKSTGNEPIQYYWVHFTGLKARALVEKCHLFDRAVISIENVSDISIEFERLFEEFIKRDECFDFLTASILISIATKINRLRVSEVKNKNTKRNLQHAISYIHTNYQKNISVEYLAELEHLSLSRFRAIFKENTGISPKDYILRHKILRAKQLLRQTDASIKVISIELGFNDQLYFSRIFREKTGLSPSEYRSIL